MPPKQILLVYTVLLVGLLLAASLISSPLALAGGPPPTGTPQTVKLSDPFLEGLVAQPARPPLKPIHMRLDLSPLPPSAVHQAAISASSSGSGWQKIMNEGFEGAFPPSGWNLIDNEPSADGGQYFWGKRNCRAHSGSYSVWAGGGGLAGGLLACGVNYADNLDTWLVYGPVDLSQVTDAELQFAMQGTMEAFIFGDIVIPLDTAGWGVSTDGEYFDGYQITGPTGDWIPGRLDLVHDPWLGNYTGQPAVWFGWSFVSDGANSDPYEGAFIDDAALWTYQAPLPPVPPPPLTLPITRHTTLTDFERGRSEAAGVVTVSGGTYGDGALIPARQMTALGPWERLPSLPAIDLTRFAAVTAKGYLFVMGGISLDTVQEQYANDRRTYSAFIYADGSLGRWVELNPLPQALALHAAVVANDHVFVLGGSNANGVQKRVFSAAINDDGTLGPWATLPDLPKSLIFHAAVAAHGYIYVLGGQEAFEGDGIVSSDIYRAKANPNGSLGSWETLPGGLPGPRRLHAAIAACDHLYLIAGADATFEWQTVYQSQIYPDGSLGAWDQAPSLAKNLSSPAAAAVRGGILVLGGWSSGNPGFDSQNKIYRASFDANCRLGDWVELTPLPYPMSSHALVVTSRYLYNLGGLNASYRYFDSVLIAPLQESNNSVRHGDFNHQFRLGNNYVLKSLHWLEEGSDATEVTLRYRVAPVANGGYGSWSAYTSTNPLPVNAFGGYLEYELKFDGASGSSDRRVEEVSLTITSNTTPTLTGLPDQTLPANTQLDNVIDLWAYAEDSEFADGDLIFTLDNTPDANAGVSLDGNRYIDLRSTSPWAVQTYVTVRATDPGGLFATDTFSVTIESNFIPVHLPLILKN